MLEILYNVLLFEMSLTYLGLLREAPVLAVQHVFPLFKLRGLTWWGKKMMICGVISVATRTSRRKTRRHFHNKKANIRKPEDSGARVGNEIASNDARPPKHPPVRAPDQEQVKKSVTAAPLVRVTATTAASGAEL